MISWITFFILYLAAIIFIGLVIPFAIGTATGTYYRAKLKTLSEFTQQDQQKTQKEEGGLHGQDCNGENKIQ
jgi:uncharacterized membrane protein